MKRFDLWKLSLLNVWQTPLRSALTVLGFSIGIAAVLAVITLGEAGRQQVQSELSRLGIDTIRITANGEGCLERGSAERLRDATMVETTELTYLSGQILTLEEQAANGTICGCEYALMQNMTLHDGRKPFAAEWTDDSQIAVIGVSLAQKLQLFPGDCVYAAQGMYRICGIVTAGDGVCLIPVEDTLFLPGGALEDLTGGLVHELQTLSYPGLSIQNAQSLIEGYFRRTGKEIQTETMQVQMEAASSVMETFVNVLKWVALVCILVGGIGIMNMLLVNVRDRRREIGIMKSLGTTPGQICMLFLLEAFVYAFSGGFLGILLGNILVYAAGMSIDLPAKTELQDSISVLFAAASLGLIFGVLPAFRASKLTCVDALRQE